jgi:hypothetical protein
MGKVNKIMKSRKECKCNRCGKVIPKGSTYYRGTINVHPDIVRCEVCGLENWEVTTSEYQLAVGEIAYRWQENYGLDDETASSIADELSNIADDCQDKLDNMPESLQDSDTGSLLQQRIENLESVISELENVDCDEIRDTVVTNYNDATGAELEVLDWDKPEQYDDFDIVESFQNELSEQIENALSELEV